MSSERLQYWSVTVTSKGKKFKITLLSIIQILNICWAVDFLIFFITFLCALMIFWSKIWIYLYTKQKFPLTIRATYIKDTFLLRAHIGNSLFSLWMLEFFRCESRGPGSFAPGRKDPGFVLQYLWNEAINHIAVFSPNNVIHRGIRCNIHSDVIDSFVSEILKYESWVIYSLTEKP